MNGYQSPSEHAAQVARVKASLALRPVTASVARPEHDARRRAALTYRLPADPNAWARP